MRVHGTKNIGDYYFIVATNGFSRDRKSKYVAFANQNLKDIAFVCNQLNIDLFLEWMFKIVIINRENIRAKVFTGLEFFENRILYLYLNFWKVFLLVHPLE